MTWIKSAGAYLRMATLTIDKDPAISGGGATMKPNCACVAGTRTRINSLASRSFSLSDVEITRTAAGRNAAGTG